MELQQLRYFMAVTKHRNFTRAAESCYVSQPALSIQIKKLEDELGGPLFHRQGRKIVLTDIGHRLSSRAESLLRQHQSTLDEIKDALSTGGACRFGAIMTIAPYLVPYMVSRIDDDERPAFHMEENFTESLLSKLLDGSLDFALMSSPVEEPRLLVKVIAKENFVLVMPSDHRLAQYVSVPFKEALSEPFMPLSPIHCAGRQVCDFYGDWKPEGKAVFESAQIETILKLVAEGQGVTLLPKMAALSTVNDGLCFREVSGAVLERDITLVQHPDRYLSESTRRMMQLVERHLNQLVGAHTADKNPVPVV